MAGDALLGGDYEIVVGAMLDADWSRWFKGFDVTPEGSNTRIRGSVPDQAALHGLLGRLRDLGIPILNVRRLENQLGEEGANGTNTPPGT